MAPTIFVPADVPPSHKSTYINNMNIITQNTERIFVFACDQKIEHLNDDFIDGDEPLEAINPEHFFKIGSHGRIGALASQLELIARYGGQYPDIPYIAKLNSKTNLVPSAGKDPISGKLWNVKDVVHIQKQSNLNFVGIGVTIYLGSEFEDSMMHFAAQSIFEAHKEGLLAMIWMYPRGALVQHDTDLHIIAGAAGAANALGADIVKVKMPTVKKTSDLNLVVKAAGNTKVIISGGEKIEQEEMFLQLIHSQLHEGHTAGVAVGRNIFQHTLPHAIQMTNAISALVYDNASVSKAIEFVS